MHTLRLCITIVWRLITMKQKKMWLVILLSFFVIFLTYYIKSQPKKTTASKTTQLLGTIITAEVYGVHSEESLTLAFNRVKEIENKMSRYIPRSEVTLINEYAGEKPVPISEDTYFVLATALEYAEKTHGAFNPVLGNIVELWGIGTPGAQIPSQEALDQFLPYLDYDKLVLSKNPYTAYLSCDKIKIDLGAIAKGYAGDEMARILSEEGIESGILNLGGNVVVIGKKPDNSLWTIGVQNPLETERGEIAGIIKPLDTSVVTSGSYERFFEEDGIRYHHILDPATGYPAQKDVISSTIISPSSTIADALSTAVYILGKDQGLMLIESLPNVEAILITDKHEVYTSSGVKDDFFTLKSKEFTNEKR